MHQECIEIKVYFTYLEVHLFRICFLIFLCLKTALKILFVQVIDEFRRHVIDELRKISPKIDKKKKNVYLIITCRIKENNEQ